MERGFAATDVGAGAFAAICGPEDTREEEQYPIHVASDVVLHG